MTTLEVATAATPPIATAPRLRIVSWNIRAGGGRRVERIAAQIEAWSPDVVALCEFRGTPPSVWLRGRLTELGLEHQLTTVSPKHLASNRLLVASRWPLHRRRRPGSPREPGRWLLAEVMAAKPFLIGAMHVPNYVSGRKYPFHDAVLRVAQEWRRKPALFVGDTNSGRKGLDEEVPVFGAREEGWMVALEAAGWHDGFRRIYGEERAYTWYSPNGRNGFRLDEAFLNRRLVPRLRDARYVWAEDAASNGRRDALSDHAALLVDIEP